MSSFSKFPTCVHFIQYSASVSIHIFFCVQYQYFYRYKTFLCSVDVSLTHQGKHIRSNFKQKPASKLQTKTFLPNTLFTSPVLCTHTLFFGTHTEGTASGPRWEICWIWQTVYCIRIADPSVTSFSLLVPVCFWPIQLHNCDRTVCATLG